MRALSVHERRSRRAPTGASGDQWRGPYLKQKKLPRDPWGRPYIYRSPGEHGAYDIISYGADGQQGGTGTAADIESWSR